MKMHRIGNCIHCITSAIVPLNMNENVGNRIGSAARVLHIRKAAVPPQVDSAEANHKFIHRQLCTVRPRHVRWVGEAKRRICGLWGSSNYIMASNEYAK